MKPDPLAELKVRFRDRALADAEGLTEALAQGDAVRIEALAHGLAGAAGLFGFTGMGSRAKAIDSLFAEGETPPPEQVEDLIAAIRDEVTTYS